jgi:hypothetical protein
MSSKYVVESAPYGWFTYLVDHHVALCIVNFKFGLGNKAITV